MFRANLSDEKVAYLSELKIQKELSQEDNEPKTYKRTGKQKELDLLWQNFKINPKEEKSPGVYLLTGFIAGALCIFIMNAILSISSNMMSRDIPIDTLDQPKYEKKISRKSQLHQVKVVPAATQTIDEPDVPAVETYTVQRGDTMSSIVTRFYGKYDKKKIEKIRQINNLTSAAKLSIGQKLIIPID